MARRRLRKKFKLSFFVLILVIGLAIFVYKNKDVKYIQTYDNKTTTQKETIESKNEVNITMVGDLLFESPFYKAIENGYDGSEYFSYIRDTLKNDDLSLGNMEVVIGNENLKVSGDGYNFCAPKSIGDLVSTLDFQVLSTVNNHTYDRGLEGINSTIDYFKDNTNIKTVGTYKNIEDKNESVILNINNIKFGFLAYTLGTNMSVPNENLFMVNYYRDPRLKKVTDEKKEEIKNDVDKLKENVDVLIVMMHWGNEFTFEPTSEQKEMANYLNSLGVDIIYGSHSHSIQPVEMVGDEHKTLVFYSLGNFISADNDIARTPAGEETFDNAYQFGLMGKVKIVKDKEGKISIENPKAEVVVNYFDKNLNNFKLIPLNDYSSDYETTHYRYSYGLTKSFITHTYNKVIDELYR